MDIRNYLSNSRKRSHKEVASDSDSDSTSDNESVMPDPRCTQPAQLVQSKLASIPGRVFAFITVRRTTGPGTSCLRMRQSFVRF